VGGGSCWGIGGNPGGEHAAKLGKGDVETDNRRWGGEGTPYNWANRKSPNGGTGHNGGMGTVKRGVPGKKKSGFHGGRPTEWGDREGRPGKKENKLGVEGEKRKRVSDKPLKQSN